MKKTWSRSHYRTQMKELLTMSDRRPRLTETRVNGEAQQLHPAGDGESTARGYAGAACPGQDDAPMTKSFSMPRRKGWPKESKLYAVSREAQQLRPDCDGESIAQSSGGVESNCQMEQRPNMRSGQLGHPQRSSEGVVPESIAQSSYGAKSHGKDLSVVLTRMGTRGGKTLRQLKAQRLATAEHQVPQLSAQRSAADCPDSSLWWDGEEPQHGRQTTT